MDRINYKIILLGNSGVGKTTFARKLYNYEFKDNNISSIGIDKVSLDVEIDIEKNGVKEKIEFDISLFDTTGQERFRSITNSYYKGSDGIILLYDVTNKQSFENVEIWINSIKDAIDMSNEEKYAIFLIGNKNDLINENIKEREVTEEEAIKVCKEYNLIWGGEQSMKNIENTQLNEIFNKYVKELYYKIGEKKGQRQKMKHFNIQKKKQTTCCLGY